MIRHRSYLVLALVGAASMVAGQAAADEGPALTGKLASYSRSPITSALGGKRARKRSGSRAAAYVAISKATDPKRRVSQNTRNAITATVRRALRNHAPEVSPGTRALPTQRQLSRLGVRGFRLDSQVSKVQVKRRGSRAMVTCSVSLRIAPWAGRDEKRLAAGQIGVAQGSGRAVAKWNRSSVKQAKRDCVLATVADVTRREVVPYIRNRTRRR